jgi:WD40 repeat protein
MQLADQAWKKHDISGLETILDRFNPKRGEYDPRGVEWHYLHTRLHESSQTLVEQNGPAGCVQFSPDGSLLAVGGQDEIRILRLPAKAPTMTFREAPPANINALAFSQNGQLLAAASNSGAVLLCDLTTGKLLKSLVGAHSEWVADIDISPDGERLCSVDGAGMIVLWDWKSGKPLQTFRGHDQALRSVHFSQDGQHVIVGRQEDNLQIWNLADQTVTASVTETQLKPRGRAVWPRDIELSADRTRMAVCWDIGGVKLYDIADISQPKLLESLPQETGNQLAFLGDDQLVVGSAYGMGKVWRLGKQDVVRELRGHRDKIVSLAVSSGGRQIITASRDGTVRAWPVEDHLANGKEIATLDGRCVKLIVSPKGDELALEQGEPRQVAILKIATGELQTVFPDLPEEPINAEFLAGGKGFAVSTQSTVSIYDRATQGAVWQWTRPASAPAENRFQELWSTDRLLLIKAVHDLWALDLKKRTLAWHLSNSVAFRDFSISPDERTLYVSDQVGKIHEIGLTDGKTSRVFETTPNPVTELAISSDGRYLLTASENRAIWLFDRARGTKIRNFASIDGSAGAARFTADGATLIARHNFGYLSFWDVSTGQRLISVGPWGVHQISWDLSPDGRTAYLAVNEDGRTSVRALTLRGSDDQPASVAQSAPAHPD